MAESTQRRQLWRWLGWFGMVNALVLALVSLRYLNGFEMGESLVTWVYLVTIYIGHHSWFSLLPLVLLLTPPVADNVLAKFVLPGVTGFAPLAPVKDEIFQLVQGDLPRYVVVHAEQLQHVFAGRPVYG